MLRSSQCTQEHAAGAEARNELWRSEQCENIPMQSDFRDVEQLPRLFGNVLGL
ncbi:hypothetical protein B0G73_112200 [Paraburkholderia sp. BL25I1N1]|nr:hypothetical protein B0G73_112200 [Paraburkholderia sp. BL25I1N1]